MPEPLNLTCHTTVNDELRAAVDTQGLVYVVVSEEEAGTLSAVYLDREAQRELFNWLGVVLHTA